MRLQSCEKVMGWCTAQCEMLLFCVKTVVKEEEEEKQFGRLTTFWFDTFVMFFRPTGQTEEL